MNTRQILARRYLLSGTFFPELDRPEDKPFELNN
jgi:hypothetical protein